MISIHWSRLLSLCMTFSLLSGSLPLSARIGNIAENLSPLESDILKNNQDVSWIYLGKDVSNLMAIVDQISELDDQLDSPLHELKNHVQEGFFLAEYSAVVEALNRAEFVLEHNFKTINPVIAQELDQSLNSLALAINRNALTISSKTVNILGENDESFDPLLTRRMRNLIVDENMVVEGKTTLEKHLHGNEGAHFHGHLKVGKDSLFKEDVKIKGDLLVQGTTSSTDAVVGSLSVTDLAVASCIDNLCVNNLSVNEAVIQNLVISGSTSDSTVTNLTVTGTASINDAIITNATILNLSSTDATITNLSVTNCVANLCVNNLSATDVAASGSLSVNNEFINGSLQIIPFTPAGIVHNNALGVLSSSLITNADVSPTAAIADTKLATISTAGKVANSATTATSTNTPNTIVLRDGSGNFSAGTITATLNGNATTATNATNFTGPLSGDVTGTQGATVVSTVGGQTASNVAAGTILANGATSANTPNAIVRRDASGNFAASNVSLAGNLSTIDAIINGNVVLGASTATSGNITKAGNVFLHGFSGTFVGNGAGNFTSTGPQNSGYGSSALSSNTTGQANTAIGFVSLASNTTGTANTAVGQNSLTSNVGGANNTGIGAHALENNTQGIVNTAVGFNALAGTTIGSSNVAVGNNTLENVTTGSRNLALGDFAGQNSATSDSDNVYIKHLGVAGESNTIRIGLSPAQAKCFIAGINGITTGAAGIAVLVDNNGQLGTVSSSASVKHDIADMGSASDNVMDLRPVTFVYNSDENNATQYGLIAEEVNQTFPDLVVYDVQGKPQTVQYHVLPVLLLNEMKKQQSIIDQQQETINQQGNSINNLVVSVDTMNSALSSLQKQIDASINRIRG